MSITPRHASPLATLPLIPTAGSSPGEKTSSSESSGPHTTTAASVLAPKTSPPSSPHVRNRISTKYAERAPVPRDSGYGSTCPSRPLASTLQHIQPADPSIRRHVPTSDARHSCLRSDMNPRSKSQALILQPDSSPISQEQLAAEVKGIYAGLVMVEAKCININAAHVADPTSPLGPEQTLLYEHHDFLMVCHATQHPSATAALRGLATKYSMPARMWKHGIHAFLEVLRHRRPDSQDYMLAFIYLAYQMMALLFETVPGFTDTWIECLGDLARYRMAIEEEKEAHATWGGVAARWYTMASDRHPAIGRLYHHLGILERPSLRKFCLYAKSLTCVIPFPNARDSLSTLCGPIVQDDQTIQSSRQSAEARIVTFHALVYTARAKTLVEDVGQDALHLLGQQPNKLRDFGAYLAVANVAALFDLGKPTNMLWQLYTAAINQAMQSSRPSVTSTMHTDDILSKLLPDMGSGPLATSTTGFFIDCFDFVIRQYNSPDMVRDSLGFVHITLVWIHSLHALRTRLNSGNHHTFDLPVDVGRLPWGVVAEFLNTLASIDPVSTYVLERARQGNFLGAERKEKAQPLSEDYTIRGLIWGQFYFCPGWFDGQCEDDGRAIETNSMAESRAERVLWLGLYLAFHTEHLHYDVQKKLFSTSMERNAATSESAHPAAVAPVDVDMEQISEAVALSPRSGTSGTRSSTSSGSSEDGFHKVKKPRTNRYTYANAVAKPPPDTTPIRPRKARRDFNAMVYAIATEHGWANGVSQEYGSVTSY
ncbi:uncharacterized protein MYCFIDRAFT_207267 [Pseudocercospora fijiensis CIRAD86]|uniref:DNA/RNA-binding domain-containing protein n=1 Tax=Pseudocercospora fijiensis (strain CIRAD86) TaxID=383855 RepID=M3B4Y3_PSEFD|nr:uncharacterized protein MYCFIDRAFT_207267 [Pseudocercospora fijiensis CIRAD86]EME84402.1 hypothetical protein MYCFIDRAFT_207267 [Pseudocercospora fijiensis CIRAD86]